MSRQVDVKALVSHIVKGDGADKCRICLGDTSEGQVYLGDTVMKDGDKAVTLAELLQTITGIQVENASALPQKICRKCKTKLKAAIPFLTLAKNSTRTWNNVIDHLQTLEAKNRQTNMYVVIDGNEMRTHVDTVKTNNIRAVTKKEVLKNLNNRLKQDLRADRIRESRQQVKMSAVYRCPECEFSFETAKKLNQHLIYIGKKLCLHCNEIVELEALEQHFREHNISSYTCKICMESFENIKSYVKHRKVSHRKGAAFCLDCKRTFKDHIALSSHRERIHAPQSCIGCNKKFSSKTCYLKHMRVCPNSEKQSKFICDYCGKEYQFKEALKIHMVNTHIVGFKFQCHVCGKKCQSRSALEEHDNTHNKILDRFVCDICGAKYSSRIGYKKHRQRHLDDGSLTEDEVKYQCNICRKTFVREKSFKTHMRAHKGKVALENPGQTRQVVESEPAVVESEPAVSEHKSVVIKKIIFV